MNAKSAVKTIPRLVDAKQLAALVGTSQTTVGTWCNEGMPVIRRKAVSGSAIEIDLRRALPWIVNKRRDKETPMSERWARARALKLERENARHLGQLMLTDDAERMLEAVGQDLKGVLEGMPGRLANELAGMSANKILERLRDEARHIRIHLAGSVERTRLPGMRDDKKPKS